VLREVVQATLLDVSRVSAQVVRDNPDRVVMGLEFVGVFA
jgi:hypothetical protein